MTLKRTVKALLARLGRYGIDVRYVQPVHGIPDEELYRPTFSPWLGGGAFGSIYAKARPHTLVSGERCFALYQLARQAASLQGVFVECGVYKGGTAMLLASVGPELHLFDTFSGMLKTDAVNDIHKAGDFADTGAEAVQARVPTAVLHQGWIPDTFNGLPERISFAHIDLDLYQPIADALAYIYPRMTNGGFMVFDDYGFPSCPGARKAVDEFFHDRNEKPLVLSSGQAIVFISRSAVV